MTRIAIGLFTMCLASTALGNMVYLDCDLRISKVFGDDARAARLNLGVGAVKHFELDIDMQKETGKWGGWSSSTYMANPTDATLRLAISGDTISLGDVIKPGGWLQVSRKTLKANASFKYLETSLGFAAIAEGSCTLVKNRKKRDNKF